MNVTGPAPVRDGSPFIARKRLTGIAVHAQLLP
jgi:hypothetical protein